MPVYFFVASVAVLNACFMMYNKKTYDLQDSVKRRVMALLEIAGVLFTVIMVFYCLVAVIPAHQ